MTNYYGQGKPFLVELAKASTPISWDDGASCGVRHLVAGVGGTSSRELWSTVMAMVFLCTIWAVALALLFPSILSLIVQYS